MRKKDRSTPTAHRVPCPPFCHGDVAGTRNTSPQGGVQVSMGGSFLASAAMRYLNPRDEPRQAGAQWLSIGTALFDMRSQLLATRFGLRMVLTFRCK